jgi:hypothetical protein
MTLIAAFRYNDPRLFARLVCLVTGGDTAHCEVAEDLGDGTYRCVSSSWLDGGARPKIMPLPAGKWRLYRTDVPARHAAAWMARNKGARYGWWKLLRFVVPFLRPSWGGPICSEACAEILGMPDSDSWNPRSFEAAVAWRYPRAEV